jgi:hypothetical protein
MVCRPGSASHHGDGRFCDDGRRSLLSRFQGTDLNAALFISEFSNLLITDSGIIDKAADASPMDLPSTPTLKCVRLSADTGITRACLLPISSEQRAVRCRDSSSTVPDFLASKKPWT